MGDSTRIISSSDTPSTNKADNAFLGGVLRKGDRIGKWSIESKLAVQSGEAELYIATGGAEKVVLKYYYHSIQPKHDILEKLAALKHPDIINLLEYGTCEDGRFYEVMEYAEGGSLDLVGNDGKQRYIPFDESRAMGIVAEIVNAFKSIHEIGIIHRDVKLSNIYFRKANGSDAVIGDFGISSLLDTEGGLSKRLTSSMSRTEGYAAPEVYSQVIGPEIDYYALGIVVYEMLTGDDPFEGMNPALVMRSTIEGRVADEILSRPAAQVISSKANTLIRGLLTSDHKTRWSYDEVARHLAGEIVEVHHTNRSIEIPPFSWNQTHILHSLKELSAMMIADTEQAKKHLYRGIIEGWLARWDQAFALEIGDIREANLAQELQMRGLRIVALRLDPGRKYRCEDGTELASLKDFIREIMSGGGSVIAAIRDLDDWIWDYLNLWGAGEILSPLKSMLATIRSDRRLVNTLVVVLNDNRVMPFETTKYKGTELSSLDQIKTLPSELRRRFLMDLEDANGVLAIWLEMVSGKTYPEAWKQDGIPAWNEVVAYWDNDSARPQKDKVSPKDGVFATADIKGNIPDLSIYTVGPTKWNQEYINSLPDECMVKLEPGEYCGLYRIEKKLHISRVNQSSRVIFQSSGSGCLILEGAGGSITDLEFGINDNEYNERCILEHKKEEDILVSIINSSWKILSCSFKRGATGICITDGSPEITNCDFSESTESAIIIAGSVSKPTINSNKIHEGRSAGIYVLDEAAGFYENNDIWGNTSSGIAISDPDTSPTVRGNKIHDGESTGISIIHGATGIYEDNDIWNNYKAGIGIGDDKTSPIVKRNIIHEGKTKGIYIRDGASGLYVDNDIWSNAGAGMYIKDQNTSPTVIGNKIHEGKDSGIYIFAGAAGLYEGNDIWGNAHPGISVRDQNTSPTVKGNKIHDGKGKGIYILAGATGIYENNDILGNDFPGITSKDRNTSPTVRGNKIHEGNDAGIAILKGAVGTYEKNDIWGNARAGIASIDQDTSPTVRENEIHEGKDAGMLILAGAAGIYENNDIWGNAKDGLCVADSTTSPTIRNNNIHDAEKYGIIICKGAGGIYESNKLSNNISGNWQLEDAAAAVIRNNHEY